MLPYPTSHEIEDIFKYRESQDTISKFDARLAPNLHVKVMGHEHHFAGEHRGKDSFKDNHRAQFYDMMDPSTPFTLDVTAIGGGESPWATVEMKSKFKAKSGKHWESDSANVVRFNREGQITVMRIYMDGAHGNNHVEEHKGKNAVKT